MTKFLPSLLACVIATGVPGAADPADTHPDLHLIPWPKKLQPGTGHMELTADSRIVAADKQLQPLAEVLSEEIALVTGMKLKVATAFQFRVWRESRTSIAMGIALRKVTSPFLVIPTCLARVSLLLRVLQRSFSVSRTRIVGETCIG